jgi:hypothetical protein
MNGLSIEVERTFDGLYQCKVNGRIVCYGASKKQVLERLAHCIEVCQSMLLTHGMGNSGYIEAHCDGVISGTRFSKG